MYNWDNCGIAQVAVNHVVAGSNPASTANPFTHQLFPSNGVTMTELTDQNSTLNNPFHDALKYCDYYQSAKRDFDAARRAANAAEAALEATKERLEEIENRRPQFGTGPYDSIVLSKVTYDGNFEFWTEGGMVKIDPEQAANFGKWLIKVAGVELNAKRHWPIGSVGRGKAKAKAKAKRK